MIRKLIAVFLAFVIVVITSGFTISSHICGGKKIKSAVAISNTDVSCGMEKTEKDCNDVGLNNNCCQDEFQKIKMDENYTQQYTKVNFSPDFTIAFIIVVFNQLSDITNQKIFFKDYSPPPLVRDIPIVIQSFLI